MAFRLTQVPAGFIDDPYPVYAALRAETPVLEMEPGVWLLTRYDDVAAAYRSPHCSSDKRLEFGPKLGAPSALFEHHTSSLVFNDPPLHTRVRRLLMGALNQRAVQRMEAELLRWVDALIDTLQARGHFCLIENFAAQIPIQVIGNLLNIPPTERAPLRNWSLAILSALEPAPSSEVLRLGNAAVADFLLYLRDLVKDRRAHPGDPASDVLTRLILGDAADAADPSDAGDAPKSQQALSESELLHNCIFLLNAGHETTTNLIGNGLHALLTQRSQWQRLRDEPALLPSAVEELLRFESPLQLNNRRSTAPLQLGDCTVPAGAFLNLAIGAANRDPARFASPNLLDIARKPNHHLAFGHGAHACSGMNVARLEARVALGRLAQHAPQLDLEGPPTRDPRIRFRGFRSLPARWA